MIELFGLFTRIRIGNHALDFEKAARNQYLIPIVGAVMGLLVAFAGWIFFEYLSSTVGILPISIIILIVLYALTGIIHIEGLADFFDGLYASGDVVKKRTAMKDSSIGAGGAFSMVVSLIILVALFSELDGDFSPVISLFQINEIPIILGIVIAEISAKLSMLTVMSIGPSSHEGMGSAFVRNSSSKRYLVGLSLSVIIGFLIAGAYGLIVLTGVGTGLIIAMIARKHFAGVGGDSFGASNELSRIVALIAWVVII